MKQALQSILHSFLPGRAYTGIRKRWHHFLRLRREGFYTAYQRRRLWPKILATPPIETDPVTDDCALCVHLMCHGGDYLAAIWALKSFYLQSRKTYPLTIHVQGPRTRVLENHLRQHFPSARFIFQDEADRAVESYLSRQGLHRLLEVRRALPIMQKLTDILIMTTARCIMILDADVLFFNNPTELAEVSTAQGKEFLVQRDFMDAYTISLESAKSDLGIDIQPAINSGIVRLTSDVIDLEKCDEYLAHPEFARPDGHAEQTLWALEASRKGLVSYLPSSYYISLGGRSDCARLKARHYAGLSRGMFTLEGIPFLLRSGFFDGLRHRLLPAPPSLEPTVDVVSRFNRVS